MRLPGLKRLKEYFRSLSNPELDWVQVEVSSFCNASCLYCPHTVFQHIWVNQHMPMAVFERLLPGLSRVKLVYLQGWGEPLLNPDFFKMVKLAKAAGCKVGTSTNGMLIDRKTIGQLIESGIDIIAFSLAGVDEHNDIVRKGTYIKTVIDIIKSINREKEKAEAKAPAIHIAYMLLRSRIHDLPKIAQTFKELGISQIVISTLDFIPVKELADESLLPANMAEYEKLQSLLDKTIAIGRSFNLDVHYNLYYPSRRRKICTENVQKALYISADGAISPCVFTNLPISGSAQQFEYIYSPYHQLIFGNIKSRSLRSVWEHKDFLKFRESFNSGELAASCQKCPKLYMISK